MNVIILDAEEKAIYTTDTTAVICRPEGWSVRFLQLDVLRAAMLLNTRLRLEGLIQESSKLSFEGTDDNHEPPFDLPSLLVYMFGCEKYAAERTVKLVRSLDSNDYCRLMQELPLKEPTDLDECEPG